MRFSRYHVWIFDCDGVILDSNAMKIAAFADVLSGYPESATAPFLAFQKTNFGLSRFRSIDSFFQCFLKRAPDQDEKEALLNRFACYCAREYPLQRVTKGARALLHTLNDLGHPCYIASGSEQSELREALSKIGIAELFQGIFGSPRKKADLVKNILACETQFSLNQVLFLGDSKADFEAAYVNGIDFLQVEAYASDPAGMKILRCDRSFDAVFDLSEINLNSIDLLNG